MKFLIQKQVVLVLPKLLKKRKEIKGYIVEERYYLLTSTYPLFFLSFCSLAQAENG